MKIRRIVPFLSLILVSDLGAVSLLKNSPFIPSGWEEKREVPGTRNVTTPEVKFMGVYRIGSVYRFNLKSTLNGKSIWLGMNGREAGLEVLDYEVSTDELTVLSDGRTMVVKLEVLSSRHTESVVLQAANQHHPKPDNLAVTSVKEMVKESTGRTLPATQRMRATSTGQSRRGGFLKHNVKRVLSNPESVRDSTASSAQDSLDSEGVQFAPRNALQKLLP